MSSRRRSVCWTKYRNIIWSPVHVNWLLRATKRNGCSEAKGVALNTKLLLAGWLQEKSQSSEFVKLAIRHCFHELPLIFSGSALVSRSEDSVKFQSKLWPSSSSFAGRFYCSLFTDDYEQKKRSMKNKGKMQGNASKKQHKMGCNLLIAIQEEKKKKWHKKWEKKKTWWQKGQDYWPAKLLTEF